MSCGRGSGRSVGEKQGQVFDATIRACYKPGFFVSGKPTDRSDFSDLKLIADKIVPLEQCRELLSRRINILLSPDLAEEIDLDKLHSLAKLYRGSCSLVFHISNGQLRQRILAQNIRVSANKVFLKKLREEYGEKNIWVE